MKKVVPTLRLSTSPPAQQLRRDAGDAPDKTKFPIKNFSLVSVIYLLSD